MRKTEETENELADRLARLVAHAATAIQEPDRVIPELVHEVVDATRTMERAQQTIVLLATGLANITVLLSDHWNCDVDEAVIRLAAMNSQQPA